MLLNVSTSVALVAPTKIDRFVEVFDALSEPLRVRMIWMMVQQSDGILPCTSLDEELPIARSTISYHVQILRRTGLIGVTKAGRNYFYQLRREVFEALVPGFLEQLAEITEEQLTA